MWFQDIVCCQVPLPSSGHSLTYRLYRNSLDLDGMRRAAICRPYGIHIIRLAVFPGLHMGIHCTEIQAVGLRRFSLQTSMGRTTGALSSNCVTLLQRVDRLITQMVVLLLLLDCDKESVHQRGRMETAEVSSVSISKMPGEIFITRAYRIICPQQYTKVF